MKNRFGYRVLAGLLAVVMTAQCTALPVFAMDIPEETETVAVVSVEESENVADTVEETDEVMGITYVEDEIEEISEGETEAEEPEEAEVMTLHDGTAIIPAGATEAEVKQALYNALVSGGSADPQSIEWEYKCKGKSVVGTEGNESWGSIDGFKTTTTSWGIPTEYTHPSLKAAKDGKYQIRIAGTTEEVTVKKASKYTTSIAVTGDTTFAMPYNEDGSVDVGALTEKLLSLVEVSPAELANELTVQYYATAKTGAVGSLGKAWVGLEGGKVTGLDYPAISTGNQQIKISFAGNDTYGKAEKEFNVTITERESANIVVNAAETVKLPYNEDGSKNYEALKENILALVDYEASTAGIEGNLTVKYEAFTVADIANTGWNKGFANLEGEKINLVDYRPISEGTQKIKLTFAGNQNYKETSVEFTVTVVGRENVTVVEKETPDTVAMVFANDDLDYDYTAIEAAVWNAVVESTDPELTAEDVTVEYAANPLYKGATDIASIALANFQPLDYKATVLGQDLRVFGKGEHYVRISFDGNTDYNAFSIIKKINVTEPERLESVVVLKEGYSISYTNDSAVIETAVLNNMVDWEASILPENADMSRFVVEYWALPDVDSLPDDLLNLIKGLGQEDNIDKLLAGAATWAPIQGGIVNGIKLFGKEFGLTYAPISAGDQKIRVSYKGNKDYMPSAAEGTISIAKASVKVTVHSTNIFADEKVPADFVTTNPVDKFDVYTVYAGITSNVTTSIFLELPDRYTTNSTIITILDKTLEALGQKTFTQIMQEGVTLGELRKLLNTQGFLDVLKLIGVDLGSMGQLLETINKLPGIGDNIRIAFATPDQAGLYTVAAITDNKNYNTGVGIGFLLVKMRTSGVKLNWNSPNNKFTAEEVANGADLGATLTYNGEAVKDQGAVKYLYTGIQSNWKPYSSTKAPTEPGSYIVTATVIGGNYMALPATRTFKITK